MIGVAPMQKPAARARVPRELVSRQRCSLSAALQLGPRRPGGPPPLAVDVSQLQASFDGRYRSKMANFFDYSNFLRYHDLWVLKGGAKFMRGCQIQRGEKVLCLPEMSAGISAWSFSWFCAYYANTGSTKIGGI